MLLMLFRPPRAPTPLPIRQLSLPLDLPPGPAPPVLPQILTTLAARHVWATLAPAARQQVRQTTLHILQEVLAHADHNDHAPQQPGR